MNETLHSNFRMALIGCGHDMLQPYFIVYTEQPQGEDEY